MKIPVLDPNRAADLANPLLLPKRAALLSATRTSARHLFFQITEKHPPKVLYRTNGMERAEWASGSTLTVASPDLAWWRGRSFDVLVLDVAELDPERLAEIAVSFVTAR